MENGNKLSQDEIYAQEEKCQKAIRTVRKAILMRFLVAALMIWVVASNPSQPWAWALTAFVLLVNTVGSLPLLQEYRSQKRRMKALIAMEET